MLRPLIPRPTYARDNQSSHPNTMTTKSVQIIIRELIVSATREGLDAARARGKVGGRPSVVNADIIRAARDMLPNPEHSITSIARLLGVSPGTLYNHIPDLQELRSARVAAQIEGGTR
jgi:DNA invertase Pin-like site-specific DNA recombinase